MNKLIQYIKTCPICNSKFTKNKNCSLYEWENKRKYCSKECCLKGTFKKDSKTAWNKGLIGYNKDYPRSDEWKEKISKSQKGIPRLHTRGENHPNWKGGVGYVKKGPRRISENKYTCQNCGIIFSVFKSKKIRKYCSNKCKSEKYKGVPLSDETKIKLSKSHINQNAWNKGKKMKTEVWNKGKKCDNISKENHWNWKGGITDENRKIRNSFEYKEWRKKVFNRDKYSCVKCGYRSNKKKDIIADHIMPFCFFPELRFDVDNGRTLCRICDADIAFNYQRDKHLYI